MNIVLFRHAEKAFAANNNPPLSERGLLQAKTILHLVQSEKLPRPSFILSSPKIRALQTLLPLSQALKIEVKQMKELDERQNSENASQFFQRVKSLISWLGQQNSNVIIVTHFDWVEEAMAAIPCDTDLQNERFHAWGSANFMNFTVQDELWHLNEFSGVDS